MFKYFVLVALFLIGLSGCTTMTIDGDGVKAPDSENGTHTSHGSYWGFVWKEPSATKCSEGRGLYRARHHTNAAYSLVSILSVGFYVPQTVEWWCDGGTRADQNEETYVPGQ